MRALPAALAPVTRPKEAIEEETDTSEVDVVKRRMLQ